MQINSSELEGKINLSKLSLRGWTREKERKKRERAVRKQNVVSVCGHKIIRKMQINDKDKCPKILSECKFSLGACACVCVSVFVSTVHGGEIRRNNLLRDKLVARMHNLQQVLVVVLAGCSTLQVAPSQSMSPSHID